MSTQASPFCEHCGAANEYQATSCYFCGKPFQDMQIVPAFASSKNLLVDTVLKGRYRIAAPLGQGGMSTVYRAQDIELDNRIVAVKELQLGGLSGRDVQNATKAFKREAAILASLQHANLPSIFEHFEEQGHWYLVMSFIQGEALDDYLNRSKEGKLPLYDVLQIGQQLCAVLYYLHNHHPPIIFRDLKPANIIRTSDGHVYLIDFGVARYFKPGKKKDTVPFGSMGYAPPEQFGKSQTTPRSDIYSLGATLYQLLSGHEPDATPFRFPPLLTLEPTLPVQLVDLITQMLNMDKDKRPANMHIVEQRLQEISKVATPLQAFPTFTLPKPAQKKRRSLFAVSMLLLLSCCLVLGGFGGNILVTNYTTASYQTQATNQARADATDLAGLNATDTAGLDANNTAIANAASTATVIAAANATNIVGEATAFPDPYQPKGVLALADPLSQAGFWQEHFNGDFGGSCQFKGGGFAVTESTVGNFYNCDESSTYTNFAMEVTMTMLQGECGGIILRDNNNAEQFYTFEVCSNGTYSFFLYKSDSVSSDLTPNTSSAAIKVGTQTNIIAIVANRSTFDLYVNNQKIDSVSDSSYSQGTLGLFADAYLTTTTALFQDVRVWTLP